MWNKERGQYTGWAVPRGTAPLADMAVQDVSANIFSHTKPGVFPGYQFECLGLAIVACTQNILVLLQEVELEFFIVRKKEVITIIEALISNFAFVEQDLVACLFATEEKGYDFRWKRVSLVRLL